MKSIRTNPANHAAEGDERIRTAVPAPGADPVYEPPAGTRVRIVDSDRMPPIRPYVGREGVTERPEADGCYVRFADNSYVWCFWGEMEAAP